MYSRYADSKGWRIEITNAEEGTAGGYSQIEFMVKGENVYSTGWDKMDPTEEIGVTVWLPEAVGNAYQGKAATITFTVYAIQSNVTDSAANTEFGITP